jgi:branched-chain amino acid transport system substrate-binding protein
MRVTAKKHRRVLGYGSVLLVLMLLAAACGGDDTASPVDVTDDEPDDVVDDAADDTADDPVDEPDEETPEPDEDAPVIRIGFPVPTSGPGAAIGNRFARAAEMAIDELNEEAGGSVVFEGYVEDSECVPEAAATAALNLALQREVDAMVGELCSSATLAVKDLAEDEGIPLIVPNSSARAITDPSHEWTFRIIPHEYHQHEALARLAYGYYGHRTAAVLYEQTDAGVGARDAFIPEFESLGGEIVLDDAFDRTAPDFTPLVTRAQNSDADMLHLTVLIEPGVRFVQTMEEQGYDVPVFSSIWFAYPLFEDTAGSAADNNIRQLFYINTGEMPEAVEFTEAYNERYPDAEEPDFNHAQFYAGVKLIGWTALECGATDRETIRDCLREAEDFRSPIGPITFDEEGQVIPTPESLIHIETQNGEVEVLDERDDFPADVYEW